MKNNGVCDIVTNGEAQYMRKTSFRQECTLVEGTMEHNLSMKNDQK